MRDRTQPLRKRIAQLEAKLRAMRQQAKAQRQRIAGKYGYEFLALLDGSHHAKIVVIDIMQKSVIQDEDGNIVSETDSSLVGKLIEVRFDSLQ